MEASRLDAVDTGLRALVERGEYTGVAAMVAQHGRVLRAICHGMQEVDADGGGVRPMAPDTIVRLASLTKPVTAVALMQLCEAGRVDLDEPITRWLPELASLTVLAPHARAAGAPLSPGQAPDTEPLRTVPTVRQVIANLAGLGYGIFDDSPVEAFMRRAKLFSRDGGVGRLRVPLSELPARVAEIPLAAQPGEEWRYGVSHDLIGELVARVSGQSFGRYLQERIFDPLGMKDTGFHVPAASVDRFAALYAAPSPGEALKRLDDPASSPFLDPQAPESGGGGLVSTLGDYGRFAMALAAGGALDGVRLLREETLAAMLGNHVLGQRFPVRFGGRPQVGMGYGLGVGVFAAHAPGAPPPGTFGWIGTSGTTVWIDPSQGTVVLALPQGVWHWAAGNLMVAQLLGPAP